jgi:hypothetical protein
MPFDNPHHLPFSDIEVLQEARGLISHGGDWVKDRFQDGNRRCLVAALSRVSHCRNLHVSNRLERRLARLLARQLPPGAPLWATMKFVSSRQRLIWFNDDPETRHEDVIALFDSTIDHLTNSVPVHVSHCM